VGDLTDVGSYTGAASPYGTFDQGGNVREWNEAITSGSNRGLRGGAFNNTAATLAASFRTLGINPATGGLVVGFRVASRQFPQGIPSLGPLGLLVVAAGLLGFRVYRRGRA
jgi:formylglycine-generating enzyme required for sulfatase activity